MPKWVRRRSIALIIVLAAGVVPDTLPAQEEVSPSVASLQQRVATLEGRVGSIEDDAAAGGLILFLFGAFCALWAQNTGRSAWGWFFLGLFFSVIAVLVLLHKNSGDIDRRLRMS